MKFKTKLVNNIFIAVTKIVKKKIKKKNIILEILTFKIVTCHILIFQYNYSLLST